MADQLATPTDLASFLQMDLDASTANLVLYAATGAVQAACRQRLVAVTSEQITLLGTTQGWLDLPERPVTAVTAVTVDGTTTTDYLRFGARLWRADGWQTACGTPSAVAVTYSHGYTVGAQGLQLAHGATLTIGGELYSRDAAVRSESIDDYSVTYEMQAASVLAAAPMLRAALRAKYGRRAGLVSLTS